MTKVWLVTGSASGLGRATSRKPCSNQAIAWSQRPAILAALKIW